LIDGVWFITGAAMNLVIGTIHFHESSFDRHEAAGLKAEDQTEKKGRFRVEPDKLVRTSFLSYPRVMIKMIRNSLQRRIVLVYLSVDFFEASLACIPTVNAGVRRRFGYSRRRLIPAPPGNSQCC
jgi:hypothetical protein